MIKTVDDYLDQLHEKFPYYTKKELKKIIKHGMRMYIKFNKKGCDFFSADSHNNQLIYTGKWFMSMLKQYKYALRKHALKARALYQLKERKWDGVYYLGVTQSKIDDLREQMDRNKKIKLYNVFLYKLKEELHNNHLIDYIFKVSTKHDLGFKVWARELVIDRKDIEYLELNENYYSWYSKKIKTANRQNEKGLNQYLL